MSLAFDQSPFCIALNEDCGVWATVGIGCIKSWQYEYKAGQHLEDLEPIQQTNQWIYHVLSYDLKSYIEPVADREGVKREMPVLVSVIPQYVIRFRVDDLNLAFEVLKGDIAPHATSCYALMHQVRTAYNGQKAFHHEVAASHLQPVQTKADYLHGLDRVKYHLQRGDIYEVNYCHPFVAQIELEDCFDHWLTLLRNSGAPFACYCRYNDWVLMCASPERFLRRKGNTLLSQPIKGTIRRGATEEEDQWLQDALRYSEKERAENVMIVDLVRNDLSRIAKKNSVRVKELFGVYQFKTVHHLISSIEAEVEPHTSMLDILNATFPMGSMTGAPKVSAMQIAENLECFERGWYSGSVGFVSPNGDFDFNVVIRSAIYNTTNNLLQCAVGGAITMASDPQLEFEETMLKVQLLQRTF